MLCSTLWAASTTATLQHTASTCRGNGASAITATVDAEKEHYNNAGNGSANWTGYAFAEFAFELPDGAVVTNATLTWQTITGGRANTNRDNNIYFLNAGTTIDYTALPSITEIGAYEFVNARTYIGNYPLKNTATGTANVTTAIQTIAEANQKFIIFQWTKNAAGADLTGKGAAENQPTLTIEYASGDEITSYTVQFVDAEGNAIKDPVKHANILKGTKVNATSSETSDFFNADKSKKYIFVSGNDEVTIADDGSTVISLVFREAAKFNYSVKAVYGEEQTEIETQTGMNFEKETAKVPYAYLYNINGKIYTTTKQSSDGKGYYLDFALTEDNIVKTLSYTPTETEVLWFSEAENIEGLTRTNNSNSVDRSSYGGSAYAAEGDVKIVTLSAGTYKLTSVMCDAQSSTPKGVLNYKIGEQTFEHAAGAINWDEKSFDFTLTEETPVFLMQGGNEKLGIDYIYISGNGSVVDTTPAFDPSTAIANNSFDANPADVVTVTTQGYERNIPAGSDQVAGMQPVTGWTPGTQTESDPGYTGGVFAYGSTNLLNNKTAAPATAPEGSESPSALGLAAVWGGVAQYTQDVTFPAGDYKLSYTVYNAANTGAVTKNLFGFIAENGTEYLSDAKTFTVGEWKTNEVTFTLAEETTGKISVGFIGSGGSGNAPHLFVDNIKLEQVAGIEIALKELNKAIEAAQAKAGTYAIGTELFTYPASEIEPLTQAIATAQAAYAAAESKEAVAAATEALNTFVGTFAPVMTAPVAEHPYYIANTTATGNLSITEGKIAVANDATTFFTAVEGGYVLSNKEGDYVFKTTDNNWTLSTTKNAAEAYVVTFVPVEGGYTIKGEKGLFGLDNTEEGSAVYANKTADKNGIWTIAEAVAPTTDYTNYIVNADLKGEGGFDATGTKGIDGSGVVKAGNNAQFDFKQTIENLPSGKYKLTAQAAYRYGVDEAAEAAAIAAGTDTKLAKLYATVGTKTVSTAVQNRNDGASETDLADGNGSVTVNDKFVPNSSSAVAAWFAAGQYVNEVVFNLAEAGDVTIGIEKTAQPEAGDYTVIGPWTLTRLGDAETEAEDPLLKEAADVLAARQSVKTKTALQAAYDAYAADATADNKTALQAAMEPAKVSVNSYKILEAGQLPDDKLDGWTCTNTNTFHINTWSVEGNSDGTGMQTPFIENWVWKGENNDVYLGVGEIFYTLPGLDPGIYSFSALIRAYSEGGNAPTGASLFAGNREKAFATGKNFEYNGMKGIYDIYAMTAEVGEDGVFRFGVKIAEERNFNWMAFKSCKVAYVGAAITEESINQLAANIPTGKMNATVKGAVDAALAAAQANANLDNYEALQSAIAAAEASTMAYGNAKAALDAMKQEMDNTNVYTQEAYDAYNKVYTDNLAAYEAGTLTDEEAGKIENPQATTGYRAANIADNFLLSAWDTNADFLDPAPYYINTWSVEGNNDGTNFKVPFFEYWVRDGESLGARTLTATMNGMKAGEYDVTAWVRVRMKDGAAAPATGITMQANDGEPVDVAAGQQVGTSQFYLDTFTATGIVGEDGVLKIKFNVAADNNISWLSFKNVKYTKKPEAPAIDENTLYCWQSVEGTPFEYGGTISYENGDGNRLNYKNDDYYTICLNGKKGNMNDATPSANAGYMLVTLDKALSEGDVIEMTAYINKNSSTKASAWFEFENGTTAEGSIYGDEANIHTDFGGVPTTTKLAVPAAAAGSKSFKMTRSQAGTNLFITKLQITSGTTVGISSVETLYKDGTIYNLRGQKVQKPTRGLYIIDGKKLFVK